MMYDLQKSTTYSEYERFKIKQHFEKHEFTKLRQFSRLSNFDQPIYPKSVIRQILACMRNEDGYTSYLLMAFMNKQISEMVKKDNVLKVLDESYKDKERIKLIPRVYDINMLKQMQWFLYTDFDFKTTTYIRDSNGNVVYRYPKKEWTFRSKSYQTDSDERYRYRFYDDSYNTEEEYQKLVRLRKERGMKRDLKKKEDIDHIELLFEDEQEKEERLENLDSNHQHETRRYIRDKQKGEMEFQESLFGFYQILFGDSDKYTVSQRKKQFVQIMTFILFDANDKQLNEKLVPFYCIFPEHLEYQMIIQELNSRNYSYSIVHQRDPPVMAVYNRMIYRLEKFLVKYPGFQKAPNFQQNYTMLLFKTKAYDKCIKFIVENKMFKLPSSVASSYENFRDNESSSYVLKEFWYILFQQLDCFQLGNISYQIGRAAFDRDDVATLRFYNTLYNLVLNKPQSAEILHRIGDIVKYSISKDEFLRYNYKAIGINPRCSTAYYNLGKYYIDNSKPEEFLAIAEPYCLLDDKGVQILEAIEKFQDKVPFQWIAKAVQLYRQTSYNTLQKGFSKISQNLRSKFDYIANRPLYNRVDYIMRLVDFESDNLQYILFLVGYKKFISDNLIYRSDYSHMDLFFD